MKLVAILSIALLGFAEIINCEHPPDAAIDKLFVALVNRIDQLEVKLEESDRAHDAEISKLRDDHHTEMEKIRNDLMTELGKKHADHLKEINMLRHNHAEEMQMMRKEHQTNLGRLQHDMVAQTTRLNELEATVREQEEHNMSIDAIVKAMATLSQEPDRENEADIEKTKRAAVIPRSHTRRAENDMDVAFFATLSNGGQHLGIDQDVAFDHVITNIGNSYNPHVGIFVAPVAGTYVFSVTLVTLGTKQAHYGIFRNTEQMTILWVNGAENSYDTSGQTAVLHLAKGDDVTIKSIELNNSLTVPNHCMFSGFLLSQDYSDSSSVVVGK